MHNNISDVVIVIGSVILLVLVLVLVLVLILILILVLRLAALGRRCLGRLLGSFVACRGAILPSKLIGLGGARVRLLLA